MKQYEMTFIVRPDLDEDGSREVVDAVLGRLQAAGGEILATVPWNPPRRRMAYPIRDFGDGFYVTTVFEFDPQALRTVESQFRLNEGILRFLIIQATEQNVKQAQQRVQQAAARPQPVQAPGQQSAPVEVAALPEGDAIADTPAPDSAPLSPPEPGEDSSPEAAPATMSEVAPAPVPEPLPEPAAVGASESPANEPSESNP